MLISNYNIKINNARYQFQLPDDTTSGVINITAATGNNLTKVGTGVTIDENRVASGFSTSDYLELANFPITYNKIVLATKVKETTYSSNVIFALQNGNRNQDKFYAALTNKKLIFYFRSSISNTNVDLSINYNYTNGTFFYIRVIIYPTKIIIGHSIDNIIWQENEINDSVKINANMPLRYGIITNIPWVLNGSIDLENTYIKVDNNYIMKGQILDSDRAIATGKGWGITG